MSKNSYSDNLSQVKVIIDGFTGRITELPKGIDEAFIKKLTEFHAGVATLNSEQEKLKADLKSKTAKLEVDMADMMKQHAEAKKRVKLDFPKEQWKELVLVTNSKVLKF